ncbi:MAG: hypothetical protein HQL40_11260, partial [Alphaproteobacteria bacterium]|nr:hypothetical protein [Alphaproteobacteria bacterium]
MDDRAVILELNRLIQTDIDAIRAYGQSIEAIDDVDIIGYGRTNRPEFCWAGPLGG